MFKRSTRLPASRPGRVAGTGGRGIVVLVVAVAAALPVLAASAGAPPTTGAFAALNPVTPLTAGTFADPPQNDMPWARWNFPPASATIAGLETDIQDAYDHNIAGLEIGQGGVPTTDQLVAIYNKANALGDHDQPQGGQRAAGRARTRTPTRTRAGRSPASEDGRQRRRDLHRAPSPARRPARSSAVEAYRCTASPCPTTGIVDLDRVVRDRPDRAR